MDEPNLNIGDYVTLSDCPYTLVVVALGHEDPPEGSRTPGRRVAMVSGAFGPVEAMKVSTKMLKPWRLMETKKVSERSNEQSNDGIKRVVEENDRFRATFITEMRAPGEGCEPFPYVGLEVVWNAGGYILMEPGAKGSVGSGSLQVRSESDALAAARVFRWIDDVTRWNTGAPTQCIPTEEAMRKIGSILEWARTSPEGNANEYAMNHSLSHHGVYLNGDFVWSGREVGVSFNGKMSAFYFYESDWCIDRMPKWELPKFSAEGLVDQLVQRFGLRVEKEWNGYRSVIFDIKMDGAKRALFRSGTMKPRPKDLPEGWW